VAASIMNYVKVDKIVNVFLSLLQDIKDYETLEHWVRGTHFKDSILDELVDYEELGSEDDLISHKLELLDDLISELEKFEDEYRNMQVNKFKQLELLRLASKYVSRSKGTALGQYEDEDYITETKECSHPPCGKVFVADPPSKMYCSERCREKAKKWRKRHINE
jgi:hypothetical protein